MKFYIKILNFLKKMTLIAYISPNLQTAKDLVRRMSKKPPSTVNILKGLKHMWNLHDSTFIRFRHHYDQNWLWKMSLLVICEILNHFVNKVTTDNKYYFTYSENFHQPI